MQVYLLGWTLIFVWAKVERVDGGQDYIVTTGLAIGDEIVTEGVGLLQDGMPITKKK